MLNSEKIIVALDTRSLSKAKKLVKTLWPRVKFFKIGLEMINTGQAPELIKFVHKLNGKVFYDAKLNDIPNTVGGAAKVISGLGVWGFTIHSSSGREAIRTAVEKSGKAKVIGVTTLTSIASVSRRNIIKSAEMLIEEGVDGIVCSVQEVIFLKKFKKILITPGIRPAWANINEQKRTATPRKAIEVGADYIVIGRPVTNPPVGMSQDEALDLILDDINKR
ncbi:MAG: orotidine-5'-phosphate decarboxylase [bacterium]|nr:orotidine-5'-phosphate decarboxylase [bacterium]